tara:strand:+ start:1153 stop:1269 length:117 start_codon:yes stop_codon:yes gene_type:complete
MKLLLIIPDYEMVPVTLKDNTIAAENLHKENSKKKREK